MTEGGRKERVCGVGENDVACNWFSHIPSRRIMCTSVPVC